MIIQSKQISVISILYCSSFDYDYRYSSPGMAYLHRVGIVHGRLSAIVCLIDSRWNVKISHWQMLTLSVQQHDRKLSGEFGGGGAEVHKLAVGGSIDRTSSCYGAGSRLSAGTMSNRPIDMCAMAPELRKDVDARPTKSSDAYSFRLFQSKVLLVRINCVDFRCKYNSREYTIRK